MRPPYLPVRLSSAITVRRKFGAGAGGTGARAVDAPTALRMATLNGARALGWEERIGSIEPGKWADLTAVDLDPIETQPVYHVVSQLVYAANRRQVSDVWIAGERRLVQGEVAGMDMAALRANAQRWARLIAAPEPQ